MKKVDEMIQVIKAEDIDYATIEEAVGELAELNTCLKPISSTMGGGFAKFKKSTYDWQIRYDEVIYVISGSMFIIENGKRYDAEAGDVFFMKEGADITYGSDDEVLCFFTLYPVNWGEANKDKVYTQTDEEMITVIKKEDLQFDTIEEAVGKSAELNTCIKPLSTTMGGGFAKFKKSTYDWQIKYDEIIYVISGSMYIEENGKRYDAKAGDVYYMKEGADIRYGSDDEVTCFFTLYPVNWRELQN
jgi:ethanolamine utilization protein EutQ (cupin superfamily)